MYIFPLQKDSHRDDPNYQTWSGAVQTTHGFVMVYSTHWIDRRHASGIHLVMASRGRVYSRFYDERWLVSQKQGAILAGKFARDVAAGKVGR